MREANSARQRAQLAELLLDETPTGLIAVSLAGSILRWNRGAELMFGYSEAEAMRGGTLEALITPEERRAEAHAARVAIGASSMQRSDCVCRRKDGTELRVDFTMRRVSAPGLEPFFALAVEASQAELRARADDLAITFQSIGDAAIVTDAAGCVVRMNPVAERLTGFPVADCLGRPLDEVFRIENEDTGEPIESPVSRVLREGIVLGLANHTVLVARDGSRRPIADSGAPIRHESGAVRGVVLVFRDVTEERQAEEALRHWKRIFHYASWGVGCVSAHDLCIRAANPAYAEMHGYTVEELIGKPLSLVWSPETRRDMEKRAHETAQQGRVVVETTHQRKDGSRLPVEVIGARITDARGQVAWFVANVQDITERKRLQQSRLRAIELEAENRRIEEANRLKSEFLANMSHELRTPLNSILGFAELLYDREVGPISPQQEDFLADILTSGRHLLRLISEVLDLTKIEAGKLEFLPEPIDLPVLVGEVVQSFHATAIARRLHLEVDLAPALDDLVLDPGRFRQVLYNFLSNALKFTPEGGRVTLRVVPEGEDQFRVEVEDTGVGIAEEDLQRLFVAFQQLDSGAAKRHGGTGLGLALTKRLTEAQGGTVGVRSTPAQGSVFFALLPRRPEPDAEAPKPLADGSATSVALLAEPEPGVALDAESRTVLVVDDDPGSRKLMARILSTLGCQALCCSDSREALRALGRLRPAAIVLDMLMPGMDGLTFLEHVRASPEHRRIPIMIWTVKDLSRDERQRIHHAVSAVVQKGVEDGSRLSIALQKLLGMRRPSEPQ